MFQSIIQDAKDNFRSGTMITQLIMINVIIFIVLVLLKVFTYNFSMNTDSWIYTQIVKEWLSTPGYWKELMVKPWTLVTSMFLHQGVWHLAWNMIVLYWFGRILGDLLGDRRVLPLYILGGLVGALVFTLSYTMIYGPNEAHALGASAAVCAIVLGTAVTSPDYTIQLIFLGMVKIKWIALAIIVIDLLGTTGGNSGGAFAHLGGAFIGYMYVSQLRNGRDIGEWVNTVFDWCKSLFSPSQRPKANMTVASRNTDRQRSAKPSRSPQTQADVDRILEKIKLNGYDSLTDEEKEILYKASKD